MTKPQSLRREFEEILNEAFNEVQSSSSWTSLGGEPPQMHEYLDKLLSAIEHRLPEKRVYLGDSSQRNAVNDANREGWNAYREAVKSILKGE